MTFAKGIPALLLEFLEQVNKRMHKGDLVDIKYLDIQKNFYQDNSVWLANIPVWLKIP